MLQDCAEEIGLYSLDTAGFEESYNITEVCFVLIFKENMWE